MRELSRSLKVQEKIFLEIFFLHWFSKRIITSPSESLLSKFLHQREDDLQRVFFPIIAGVSCSEVGWASLPVLLAFDSSTQEKVLRRTINDLSTAVDNIVCNFFMCSDEISLSQIR
jgi:hypothetical protein